MYAGNAEDYFRAGLSAVECIDQVLSSSQVADVKSVLDMPCGYGRELRFLVQRFPGAQCTACDIQEGAADFCAQAFGTFAAYSQPDIRRVSFPRSFDLVWCGSLVTHLNRADTRDLFALFSRYQNLNGVIIVTTNGEFVGQQMRAGATYDLPAVAISQLLAEYEQTGYGYQDYSRGAGYFDFHPAGKGYGVSLTSPAAIREIAREVGNLEELLFKEHGWADHQDVFAFKKSA
jgi:SAM-dependent methyltransferase